MLDRLTSPALLAISLARVEADESGEARVAPRHLLVGLASTPGSKSTDVLAAAGVRTRSVAGDSREYRFATVIVPKDATDVLATPLTDETHEILQASVEIADGMRHPLVGTEHVLVALLELADPEIRGQLASHGVTAETVRAAVFAQRA